MKANKKYFSYERLVLNIFSKFTEGQLTLNLPNKEQKTFGHGGEASAIEITIHNSTFFKDIALKGDIGLAESYIDGHWDSHTPEAFIYWLLKNKKQLPPRHRIKKIASSILSMIERIRHRAKANSLDGSKRNIMAHYDLGNALYERFLDPSMTYSCGYFKDKSTSLEEAQYEKYDRLCRKLGLKPGMRVLEIGCGWGGFAHHAAQHYQCHVTGITLSPAQLEFAQARIKNAQLEELVDLRLCDYRKMQGQYDAIVSIEMLEAVGHQYLPTFFKQCEALLKPDAMLALQVITCPDSRYEAYRRGSDFIRKHIFPGGHLPSMGALQDAFSENTQLDLAHLESFGQHYAETLRLWRDNFENNWDAIVPHGFDERFRRLWRMYLAYCEASFDARHINLVQCVLARPNEKGMPSEMLKEICKGTEHSFPRTQNETKEVMVSVC